VKQEKRTRRAIVLYGSHCISLYRQICLQSDKKKKAGSRIASFLCISQLSVATPNNITFCQVIRSHATFGGSGV